MTRRERDLRRLATDHGFRLEQGRRHWRLVHPAGMIVHAAATPSDVNHLTLVRKALRHALRRQSDDGRG